MADHTGPGSEQEVEPALCDLLLARFYLLKLSKTFLKSVSSW